ncbi:hypothetical protein L7F22_041285 [Adiantum nelumboides]|nr:hypothetical protein [Adiantum nelumboides]MCO5587336.1 hypothetical protein [Adiantum nelumboides]
MLAIKSFEDMRQEGILPEDITFSSVLAVCSHEGLVDKGLSYFESMITEYKVIPTIEHSNCLVDMLARAGQLSSAVALLESIPEAPTSITWNVLLGACKNWGSLHIGLQAFEVALNLNKTEAASYYLMSGIFADAGMWSEVKSLEALRAQYTHF